MFIVDHTDNPGDFKYNLDLSIQRAESVLQTLVDEYDISGDQLEAKGETFLARLYPTIQMKGWNKNRRDGDGHSIMKCLKPAAHLSTLIR